MEKFAVFMINPQGFFRAVGRLYPEFTDHFSKGPIPSDVDYTYADYDLIIISTDDIAPSHYQEAKKADLDA